MKGINVLGNDEIEFVTLLSTCTFASRSDVLLLRIGNQMPFSSSSQKFKTLFNNLSIRINERTTAAEWNSFILLNEIRRFDDLGHHFQE